MLIKKGRGAAIAVPFSNNRKVGPVAATYAPIEQSCPKTCPLLNNGCYAQGGRTALHNKRIEEQATGAGPIDIARAEAEAIRQLDAVGLALRLHVTGDCRTNAAAKVVSSAAEGYMRRGGGIVWTYTHAWEKVEREFWGKVSVLASIECFADAYAAIARGYAPAIVVDKHPEDGRAWMHEYGLKVLPCPEQTRGVRCTDCKLCFKADWLLQERIVIAFEAHGSGKKRVQELVYRAAA